MHERRSQILRIGVQAEAWYAAGSLVLIIIIVTHAVDIRSRLSGDFVARTARALLLRWRIQPDSIAKPGKETHQAQHATYNLLCRQVVTDPDPSALGSPASYKKIVA